MKSLQDILNNIQTTEVVGDLNVSVIGITADSREVKEGYAFVAVSGTQVDGHNFITKAIDLGASVIVCENTPDSIMEGVVYVIVPNSSKVLGEASSNFYGNPSDKVKLIGVTGTNGKTSTVTLLFSLFAKLGYSVGLLSTVENKINEEIIPSTHTTPGPVQLNALLARMVAEGVTHCFMEVSSHAVEQNRIAGLSFDVGVFTNMSRDHLDYHKTFDAYIAAKKKFFDQMASSTYALVNLDDRRGSVMLQNCKGIHKSYAIKRMADFKGKILSNSINGLEFEINGKLSWFRLIGEFNAYNLLSVFAVASCLGEQEEDVLEVLSGLPTARGRFEIVRGSNGVTGVVDYAHTPDALDNVLKTIQQIVAKGTSVLTVVGCGGDRDKGKRPQMAEIAVKHSDKVILTSDNPRTEDPDQILKDMQAGIPEGASMKALTISDRKEAIKTASFLAKPGDVILVAGKGHEDYQEINGVKHHFDDKEILNEIFQTSN